MGQNARWADLAGGTAEADGFVAGRSQAPSGTFEALPLIKFNIRFSDKNYLLP